jgi:hypothetical protein
MDEHIKRVFVIEIERQTKFALTAITDLENALRGRNIDVIWYSVQAFLIAVGNLSKLFWLVERRYADRGRELREAFEVGDDSVLAPRTFRNHFEHFDERLELWAATSPHRNFVDSNVGPPGMVAGIDPNDYLQLRHATVRCHISRRHLLIAPDNRGRSALA